MRRSPHWLVVILAFVSHNVLSQTTLVEYEFIPGKAFIITNTSGKSVSAQCEMHVASNTNHNLAIAALKGSGVINGTSIKKGESMVLSIRQMQRIPLTATQDAQAQFTNLGPYTLKVSCG